MGRKPKPAVPGRVPDEQFSLAAFQKLREELEDIKSLPPPSTAPNADKGLLNVRGDRHTAADDPQGSMFKDYVRYFSQSRYDEQRKKQGPGDFDLSFNKKTFKASSRHQKLADASAFRANPDWIEERAELVAKHGSWFRVKTAQDRARQRQQEKDAGIVLKPNKKRVQSKIVCQLQELQNEFKEGTGESKFANMKSGKFGELKKRFSLEDLGYQESPRTKMVFQFLEWALWHFDSLHEAFKAIDVNTNSSVSRDEFVHACRMKHFMGDAQMVYDILDADKNGEISLREFTTFKPYLEEFIDDLEARNLTDSSWQPTLEDPSTSADSSPAARARASMAHSVYMPRSPGDKLIERYNLMLKERNDKQHEAEKRLRQSLTSKCLPARGLPQTCSVTLFRNADQHHTGRPLFMKKMPSSLANLFEMCDRVVPPVLGTVKALLDRNLKPLKSMEDLHDGAVLLAKGPEALYPPAAFWDGLVDRKAVNFDATNTQKTMIPGGKLSPVSTAWNSTRLEDSTAFTTSTTSAGSRDQLNATASSLSPSSSADVRPLVVFQSYELSRSRDPCTRSRDREWRIYEGALGNITADQDFAEDFGLTHLRSSQSTPELLNQSYWSSPGTKSSKVDKATITSRCSTPEFEMPFENWKRMHNGKLLQDGDCSPY